MLKTLKRVKYNIIASGNLYVSEFPGQNDFFDLENLQYSSYLSKKKNLQYSNCRSFRPHKLKFKKLYPDHGK